MTIDIGTGDGQAVLRRARAEPSRLFVGVDAERSGLAAASRRASRKSARLVNVLFVLAPAERLPAELDATAGEVMVLFPWGSLLRAVALPDPSVLAQIRRACLPGATLQAVFSYDPAREAREVARLGLPPASDAANLAAAYADAGFRIERVERLERADLLAIPSTWAQRHAHGRPRPVWRLRARPV